MDGGNRGVCRVKAEYLDNTTTVERVGPTRGMNRGKDREVASIPGTARPTFAGESNFLHHDVIQRLKAIVRAKKPRDEAPAVEGDATSRVVDVEGRRLRVGRMRDVLQGKLVLAPLTTVGNLPFRRLCKVLGADVTVSEMAVTRNLLALQQSEWSLLRRHSSEDVFGIQLAVSRPFEAEAIGKALAASEFSYDFIDINAGCPIDLICRQGCGFGLWEKRNRLRGVVAGLETHQSKPVTIKCRIGMDERGPTLHSHIGEYGDMGLSAVTIHGRSKRQRYTKLADWEYIENCAKACSLPLIGNGDILSVEDYLEHKERHGSVSGHMIGRGALIKPWIFKEMKEGRVMDISSGERLDLMKQWASFAIDHWGSDERGIATARRYFCEWQSFHCRYVPVGLLEVLPQRINERPPRYFGRDDLETLMASDSVDDWIRLSELVLGPAGEKFRFTPKHKSNSYSTSAAPGEE